MGDSMESPKERPILMVVQDDEVVHRLVASSVGRPGCDVWLAGDGAEAAAMLRQRPERTAVVLVEGPLPGVEESVALRSFTPLVPGARWCFLQGEAPTPGGAIVYADASELGKLLRDGGRDFSAGTSHGWRWHGASVGFRDSARRRLQAG